MAQATRTISCPDCNAQVRLTPRGLIRKHLDGDGETCRASGGEVHRLTISLFNTDDGARDELTLTGTWSGDAFRTYFRTVDGAEYRMSRDFSGARFLHGLPGYPWEQTRTHCGGWTARVATQEPA